MKKYVLLILSCILITLAITSCQHKHYSNRFETIPPTCTKGGEIIYYCKCGEITDRWINTDPVHTDNNGDYHCDLCEAILCLEHNYVYTQKVDPTCTSTGYTAGYTCRKCGDSVSPEVIPMVEHVFDFPCYPHCSSCDHFYPDLAKTEHIYDNDFDPVCNECGIDRTVLECPHANINVTTQALSPTCTEDGYTLAGSCIDCGTRIYSEIVEAVGHEWDEGIETTAPMCEAAGIMTYTCIRGCTKTESIPPLGHNYESNDICSNCKIHISSNELSFTSNGDGTCSVSQGSCVRSHIVIPEFSPAGDLVTAIAEKGFYLNNTLTSIEIPDSVTSIGNQAFAGSPLLTTALFGKNSKLTYIGAEAFTQCHMLKNFNIPSGVTFIGDMAFKQCVALTDITLSSGLSSISNGTFVNCTSLSSVVIPKGIESIGNSAFYGCSALSYIELPDTINNLGTNAFKECTSLAQIKLPESLSKIGEDAFKDTALYNDKANWDGDIFYINNHLIKSIAAIYDTYTVRIGTTTIANEAFYRYCPTGIVIPSSLKYIGNYAFKDHGLKSVYISDIAKWCELSIGMNSAPLFRDAKLYLNNKEIITLIIPEGVSSIHSYAFHNCTSITSVSIPASVQKIDDSAFNGCTSLSSFTFDNNIKMEHLGSIFDGSAITSIEIPASVTSIDYTAFLRTMQLTQINVSAESDAYKSVDGVLYNYDGTMLIKYPPAKENKYFTVPDKTVSFDTCAFAYSTNLTSISLPEGITRLESEVFFNCTSLTEITLPKTIAHIGQSAFKKCNSLTEIHYRGSQSQWHAVSKNEPSGIYICYNCMH